MTVTTFEVADLFCGAGGSSTGAQQAIESIGGKLDLLAINHWDLAIETHSANHPEARHYVEDVSVVDPERVVPGGHLHLLMASPECRFYSRARGGKPIHDQGRMNPWVVHRWITAITVDCVLIENVPEFTEWGPLDEDFKPNKLKKGIYFQSWLRAFWDMGYTAEYRMLNAADFGDATTRTRFFLQARRDGKPIVWPEPTHAKGDVGMFEGRRKWRAAREIINWEDQGRSILDDPKYTKRPLSPKTLSRIAKGLEKFGGPLAHLYIQLLGVEAQAPAKNGQPGAANVLPGSFMVEASKASFLLSQQSGGAARSTGDPVSTVTGGGAISLTEPVITIAKGKSYARGIGEPVPTATGIRHLALAEPVLAQYNDGSKTAHSVDKPLPTISTKDRFGVATPMLVQPGQPGGNGSYVRPVDAPIPTLTTSCDIHLAEPVLVDVAHGDPSGPHVTPQGAPLPTVTGTNRMALAQPMAVPYGPKATARSTEEPLHTIMVKDRLALAVPSAEPVLVETAHAGSPTGRSSSTEHPLGAMTTHRSTALATPTIEPFLVPQFGERPGQAARVHDVDEPLPAVTSHGAGALVDPGMVLVEPMLQAVKESGVDPRRIVLIDGKPYMLDIRFRMLRNEELAKAMGFSDDESKYEFHGTVAQVTKQIGNAVPVHLAAALVKVMLQ